MTGSTRKLKRQGGQPSPSILQKRREIGVPEELLHEPAWLIAREMGITQAQLRYRLYNRAY